MKIRMHGNSVRYRLSRTDMVQLAHEGYLEETVNFGAAKLKYALEAGDIYRHLEIQFKAACITLCMPGAWLAEWTETERVGFDSRIHLPDGTALYLLVEKDFKCLDNTIEDQSDNYENPHSATS